ncbi:unnamed protein product [Rotaria sordida]|uniref:VWFA domain-containing protein n=1 Tax=Rotaria sordida TaxID=392033 RepID=A0A815Z955_9BILA|nr:unnamed protein product [Rotaria sordida]CAF1580519.1 unnamed protein product [Rotaria sordida]
MKQTASSSFSSPFKGKTLVLELGGEIGFKAKQELINYLREQQAYISYILTASETNDKSDVFFALELQVIPEQYYDRTTSDYRLRFRYEKQTIAGEGQEQGKQISIQYAFGDNSNEQQQLFASYYYRVATMPRVIRIREMLPDKLGSKLLLRDNEYAIYELDQQRLLYIVEVSWVPNDVLNIKLERLPIIHHQQHLLKLNEYVEVPLTIDDEVIQVAEQDYGLVCPSSGKLVPLKSFHIRAQIIDTIVEVVLYQVYHNTSSIPIEAKYVFPLDENSTVCGFEAHINNKVIKGIVKEKEQAKQEYREAIEKGHGAYLMHQEQAEVFSVAVGNLPANTEVIIKIIYVAELEIENGDIIFRFPVKMASWQAKQVIETKDQSTIRSIDIVDEKVEFSLKASIQMPYEIIKLFSPTHRLRRKLTDCVAMIELVDNILLDRDFVLSITLKNANLPRMLNETLSFDDDDNDSQACMLTFYPRFEILTKSNEPIEIIFLIDVSNSMDGSHAQQAKQLTHLFLTNLTIDNEKILFNIVIFGSDNDECFPIAAPATKENLDKAKYFVLHSLVHRGNTDLFAVLYRYSLLPSSSKCARQFILLSDGHIHDLQSILGLLENQSTMCRDRLFACSIGNVANKHDLKRLTRAVSGGGLIIIFDSNYRSKWKIKVRNILEHIRQPCVTSVSIDWHDNSLDEQQKFHSQAPKMIRSLFNGMKLTIYRFIRNCHKATLTATINGQEFVTTVFSSAITMTKGRILHCLTARAIIDDFDNGLLHIDESENELIKIQYKRDLIDLSIKYSVISPYTSFVAIEERDATQIHQTGVRLVDVMIDRDIDLLSYIGWDGDMSHLTSMKQKLIDARISLESASILRKQDLIVDIEKFCEKISYRSGDDAKFDMMMSIIRTYRYAFKEPEKANQIENKMRNGK